LILLHIRFVGLVFCLLLFFTEPHCQARLEADRALELDGKLKTINEDLKNEIIQRQNIELALSSAQGKIREQEAVTRELQMTLERVSSNASGSTTAYEDAKRENTRLLSRIRELEANVHQLATPAPTRIRSRPRSSSVPDARVISLERQLAEFRDSAARHDTEMRIAAEKLQRVQDQFNQTENERMALERRTAREMKEKDDRLEECMEELEFLRLRTNDDTARAREEELIRRIEMEEANAETLRLQLRQQDAELCKLQKAGQAMRDTEKRLSVERSRADDAVASRDRLVVEMEHLAQELHVVRSQATESQSFIDEISSQKRYVYLFLRPMRSRP
jgi:hypothetical protein